MRGRWFSLGTLVSSTNKTDHHDITEIFLKVALNTITLTQGRIQDFKLGEAHLKKIAPSGGRRENFWGISSEKSRFYAKKIIFFPILWGGRVPGAPPPPWIRPCNPLWHGTFISLIDTWIYNNGKVGTDKIVQYYL